MPRFRSSLFKALARQDMSGLNRALKNLGDDPDLLEQSDPDTGRTPLSTAAQRGWNEGVIRLLDHGALPDACPDALGNGQTALMHLLRHDYATVIPALDRLLAAGARLDTVSNSEEHPMGVAAAVGNVDGLRRLAAIAPCWINALPPGAFWRPLEDAAFGGQALACMALLDLGADPNLRHQAGPNPGSMYDGWTPLHLSARMGHLEVAQRLLDAGADPELPLTPLERDPHDRTNRRVRTAMDIARSHQQQAMVQLLEARALRQTMDDPLLTLRPLPDPLTNVVPRRRL